MEECAEHFLCLSERKQDLTRIVLRECVALVMVRRAWHSDGPLLPWKKCPGLVCFFIPCVLNPTSSHILKSLHLGIHHRSMSER